MVIVALIHSFPTTMAQVQRRSRLASRRHDAGASSRGASSASAQHPSDRETSCSLRTAPKSPCSLRTAHQRHRTPSGWVHLQSGRPVRARNRRFGDHKLRPVFLTRNLAPTVTAQALTATATPSPCAKGESCRQATDGSARLEQIGMSALWNVLARE